MDPASSPTDIEQLLRHREWLRAMIGQIVRDEATRDDVEQEAWLSLLRFKAPIRNLRALVTKVARGLALNSLRDVSRRRSRDARFVGANSNCVPDVPDDLLDRAETERRILGFVLELDEPYRRTLLLRFFEDLGTAEIAARTRAPAATVRSRIHRGLAMLRVRLDGIEGAGESGVRAWRALAIPAIGSDGVKATAIMTLTMGATIMRWKSVAAAAVLVLATTGLFHVWSDPPSIAIDSTPSDAEIDSERFTATSLPGDPLPRIEATESREAGATVASESPVAVRTATVSGRIRFATSRLPLPGATITFRWFDKTPVEKSCVSASQGEYELADVPVDRRLMVRITAESMFPVERQLVVPTAGDHRLDLDLEEIEIVRGHVVDAITKRDLSDADVSIDIRNSSLGGSDTTLRLKTDVSGVFEGRIPAGSLRHHTAWLRVAAPTYASTRCADLAGAITESPRETGLEIPLWPACRFRGKVRPKGGATATAAQIALVDIVADPMRDTTGADTGSFSTFEIECSRMFVQTDSTGAYVFDGIAPFCHGKIECTSKGFESCVYPFEATSPGESRSIDFDLLRTEPTAVLEGRLTFNGRPGPIHYSLRVNDGGATTRHQAGPDGRYRHEGLEPGEASIWAEIPGIGSKVAYATLTSGSTAELDVDVQAATSWVGGTVLLPDRSVAPGMTISLRGESADWRVGLTTDARGRFRVLSGVEAGQGVIVRADRNGFTFEQRIRAGDESAEVLLSEIGHVRLRIVDIATREPIVDPAIRVRPRTETDPLEAPVVNKHSLPGDLIEIDLAVGMYELDIDRTPLFYSPVRVLVSAASNPGDRIVELPAESTGIARILLSSELDGAKREKGTAIYWRRRGDPTPARRVLSRAILRSTDAGQDLLLPAGMIEIGFGSARSESAETMLPAIEIVANGPPTVVTAAGK